MQHVRDISDAHGPQVVRVSELRRLAHGVTREIFERPGHPDQILKVVRPEKWVAYRQKRGLWARLKHRFTLGRYKFLSKEYRSYLRSAWLADRYGRNIPMVEFGPLIRTDQGLAQVARKASDGQGGLAPTLAGLRDDGSLFRPTMIDRLNAFVGDVYVTRVIASDLSTQNIVLDSGLQPARFVLIDGFGDNALLPLRVWFRRLNERQLDQRFARMAAALRLDWDAEARLYRLQPG
ncbi:MAG: YrbL family protein [Pseudomonadota bacterium]